MNARCIGVEYLSGGRLSVYPLRGWVSIGERGGCFISCELVLPFCVGFMFILGRICGVFRMELVFHDGQN